ncbi:fimbrial protein [Pseudomonas sp. W15Feb34]|uniref:fimbrial protein n=1 Tax=Pseudomonas sp. W15Feb34 TaxID=550727 RepID=UPI0020058964|nr:fimbrial protein [Pseudomonas sp. W15Feb34]
MLSRAIGLLLIISSVPAMADCIGCNQVVNLTLTETLDSHANMPGRTMASSSFTVNELDSGLGVGVKSNSFTGLDGSIPSYGTRYTDWHYQRVDDYLSVAVRTRHNSCGNYAYVPFSGPTGLSGTCKPGESGSGIVSTTWDSSIKITKKMVGGVYQNNLLLGTWGACNGWRCNTHEVVFAKVYLNYSITVPENCVLDTTDLVTVDFPNSISTGAFKTAGAKAEGVSPEVRSIALQCSNIKQQASLTMRVQADKVSGDAIVSTNPDVGFVVTDKSEKHLRPNSFNSLIPFNLDNNGSANVTIKVFPVSVTGKPPAEGPVTSRAYLRVDYQ